MSQYPSQPRIHGNGFVQVDLDEERRLHIWDHRIPRQGTDSSVHDHAFSFDSVTLLGTLINVNLEAEFNSHVRIKRGGGFCRPTHNLYRVVRDEGTAETRLASMRSRCRFHARDTQFVVAGEGYHMPARQFHCSAHLGTTVTLIRKGPTVTKIARVACRVGERPDNAWVRGEQEIPPWALELIDRYGS